MGHLRLVVGVAVLAVLASLALVEAKQGIFCLSSLIIGLLLLR
jgi:hypothetical protein